MHCMPHLCNIKAVAKLELEFVQPLGHRGTSGLKALFGLVLHSEAGAGQGLQTVLWHNIMLTSDVTAKPKSWPLGHL